MSRYCITGAAGFIGSSLTRRLLEDGHELLVIDDFSNSLFLSSAEEWTKKLSVDGVVEVYITDICDADESFFDGVDVVFHLAAKTSVVASWKNIKEYEQINALGTLNILECVRRAGVKRFVYASTAAVYGGGDDGGLLQGDLPYPKTEADYCYPLSPYGATKLQGENFCRFYGELGVPYTICRFFNVFGPDQKHRMSFPYSSVIPTFIRKALFEESPNIYGDGLQTRDFIYVNDVVDALIRLSQDERTIGETYNIGSGRSCSVLDLWKMVREFSSVKPDHLFATPRKGEIRHNLADIRKVREILGVEFPKHFLERALWETFLGFKEE